jgi:hypothetical protein
MASGGQRSLPKHPLVPCRCMLSCCCRWRVFGAARCHITSFSAGCAKKCSWRTPRRVQEAVAALEPKLFLDKKARRSTMPTPVISKAALVDCRTGLLILGTEQRVDHRIAHHFVEHSAWWDHPRAGWVRAPKHADRLVQGAYGWEVSFGANRFLAELAIKRFIACVNGFLHKREVGIPYSYANLLENLRQNVLASVGNYQGDEFSGYYPASGEMMVFGTQAIRITDCVNIVEATARLDIHFAGR